MSIDQRLIMVLQLVLIPTGELVLKDFDIQREACGTSKPTMKIFNATVAQHTLQIRFYWAGKGTTSISTRGVYGPLVYAISVDPKEKEDLSTLFKCKINYGCKQSKFILGTKPDREGK